MLLANTDNGLWLIIGVGAVLTVYLVFRPMMRKKRGADPTFKPLGNNLSQQREVERQMQDVLVELSNMARQISAQLDTRAAKLEELIRQADSRISALEQETTRDPSKDAADEYMRQIGQASREPQEKTDEKADAPDADELHSRVYELADSGRSAREIAQEIDKPTGEVELILSLRSR